MQLAGHRSYFEHTIVVVLKFGLAPHDTELASSVQKPKSDGGCEVHLKHPAKGEPAVNEGSKGDVRMSGLSMKTVFTIVSKLLINLHWFMYVFNVGLRTVNGHCAASGEHIQILPQALATGRKLDKKTFIIYYIYIIYYTEHGNR